MRLPAVLSYAAAYFSLILTVAVLLRDKGSFVHRAFAAGSFLFAAEELLRGLSYSAVLAGDVVYWQKRLLLISALVPSVWIAFSLTYGRARFETLKSRWTWVLLGVAAVPVGFIAAFRKEIFVGSTHLGGAARWLIPLGWAGNALQFFFLLASVFIVFNVERTIRSSTGRIRWQIKFMALGVGGLFALRIYLTSQALLFSRVDTGFGPIDAVAVIVANVLFALSLARGRFLNVNLYISTATIQNSFTIILTAIYLLAVGLLARSARYLIPDQSLPFDALIVFLALTALAALLLSNRLRRRLLLVVTTHFRRPTYDYRRIWMDVTQRTTSLIDVHELSNAICKVVSESLGVLSVSVWLADESQRSMTLAGSTALPSVHAKQLKKAGESASEFITFLQDQPDCVDLSERSLAWPAQVMSACPEFFRDSKLRYAIRLQAAGQLVGVMTLNDDRVGGDKALSAEDLLLLETLASQLAGNILNVKLSARLRQAKEIETFQTVSTFFVHDLKNLASRLSLTMQNLPANFESPEFRADALRVISGSVVKIDDMCSRLAMLKRSIDLTLSEADLKVLLAGTLAEFKGNIKADIESDLRQVPKALLDSEQIRKVVTNLVLNASEAVNGNGVIRVSTIHEGNMVGFCVRDNGSGMSEEFIEKALFRPFQTTKKKGLGIGLFHSKLIVEAHQGRIEVSSAVGKGTEFRVVLPRTR
jgi:putative PEP-CTERM system histidine kinase